MNDNNIVSLQNQLTEKVNVMYKIFKKQSILEEQKIIALTIANQIADHIINDLTTRASFKVKELEYNVYLKDSLTIGTANYPIRFDINIISEKELFNMIKSFINQYDIFCADVKKSGQFTYIQITLTDMHIACDIFDDYS